MKRIISAMFALIAILPFAVFANGKAESSSTGGGKKITIAFLYQDLETQFWVAGHKAIVDTLNKDGVNVIEKNAHDSADTQLQQAKDVITQGVDGIIIIPQDGESAVTIGKVANKAGIPFAVFNRPPSNKDAKAIVAVADNRTIARGIVEYMAEQAKKLGHKVNPLIMVGNLGDPNAVQRKLGFYDVINKYPDLFNKPVEVPTQWNANVALQNLQSAMQAHPNVDFLFTSSDFMWPQIKQVLDPLGKWKKIGEPGHVITGGLDGDVGACQLIKDGYIDGTGVQDVYAEANMIMNAMLAAIKAGEKTPDKWMLDPGFDLTHANFATKSQDMWGCILLAQKQNKG
ncbi:sugar ABC transporter substrate-binding protein [Salinispira pacifica]